MKLIENVTGGGCHNQEEKTKYGMKNSNVVLSSELNSRYGNLC